MPSQPVSMYSSAQFSRAQISPSVSKSQPSASPVSSSMKLKGGYAFSVATTTVRPPRSGKWPSAKSAACGAISKNKTASTTKLLRAFIYSLPCMTSLLMVKNINRIYSNTVRANVLETRSSLTFSNRRLLSRSTMLARLISDVDRALPARSQNGGNGLDQCRGGTAPIPLCRANGECPDDRFSLAARQSDRTRN